MWEYREGEIMYELLLDRHGNGAYDWKQGRFETTTLSGDLWSRVWIQIANDRESGFEARLENDGMTTRGRW